MSLTAVLQLCLVILVENTRKLLAQELTEIRCRAQSNVVPRSPAQKQWSCATRVQATGNRPCCLLDQLLENALAPILVSLRLTSKSQLSPTSLWDSRILVKMRVVSWDNNQPTRAYPQLFPLPRSLPQKSVEQLVSRVQVVATEAMAMPAAWNRS